MLTRTLAAIAFFVSFTVVAQDLPKTQFKVIGLNSPTVASIVDEVPFWRETLPKASNGAITADITPLDQMGIDDKTMLRLLRLGVMDFAGMDISKMAGDDPRFEGCDLAGITLDRRQGARRLRSLPRGDRPADAEELEREAARLRRQPAAGVLVPQRARRPRRPQGQEGARVQQHHARLPLRRRRHRGEHGVRRGRAGAQQRRGRLRRHRQPVGQHRGLARGDEVALSDVARLEHQRAWR